MITGGSGSEKTNVLLNLKKEQDDIDNIYLYAKDLSKPKYKFLIEKREDARIKHLHDLKAFISVKILWMMFIENIDEYNPNGRREIVIVFDDMIADIVTNKKFQAIIKELFVRCRKLNISLAFIAQSYFSLPKNKKYITLKRLIERIN